MSTPHKTPWRTLVIGILVVTVSACTESHARDRAEEGERTLTITVCDQRETRDGFVDIITAADGEVFYLIPSQIENRTLVVGAVHEIQVETSASDNTLIVEHQPLDQKAQPCP